MWCAINSQKSDATSVLISTSARLSHFCQGIQRVTQILRRCSNWSNRMSVCLGPPLWMPDRIGDSWGAPSQTKKQQNQSLEARSNNDLQLHTRIWKSADKIWCKLCSHLLQIDLLYFQLPIGRFGRYCLLPRQPRGSRLRQVEAATQQWNLDSLAEIF